MQLTVYLYIKLQLLSNFNFKLLNASIGLCKNHFLVICISSFELHNTSKGRPLSYVSQPLPA